jgi:hypothetical protein
LAHVAPFPGDASTGTVPSFAWASA